MYIYMALIVQSSTLGGLPDGILSVSMKGYVYLFTCLEIQKQILVVKKTLKCKLINSLNMEKFGV